MSLQILREPESSSASALLNGHLRTLAPKLTSYQVELSTLIEAIESVEPCAKAVVRYAKIRSADPEAVIESVQHAIVYLGLIDAKRFLFAYLLLDFEHEDQRQVVSLLVRARITSELFVTSGPLNKDFAFIAALLTRKKLLVIQKPETIYLLFKMPMESRAALKSYDFGLRRSLKQALILESLHQKGQLETGCSDAEFNEAYKDSIRWANVVVSTVNQSN